MVSSNAVGGDTVVVAAKACSLDPNNTKSDEPMEAAVVVALVVVE